MVFHPFVGGYPEIAVGEEFFLHLRNFFVISYFHLKEAFSGIELSGVILELLETFVDIDGCLGDIFGGFEILKGME